MGSSNDTLKIAERNRLTYFHLYDNECGNASLPFPDTAISIEYRGYADVAVEPQYVYDQFTDQDRYLCDDYQVYLEEVEWRIDTGIDADEGGGWQKIDQDLLYADRSKTMISNERQLLLELRNELEACAIAAFQRQKFTYQEEE